MRHRVAGARRPQWKADTKESRRRPRSPTVCRAGGANEDQRRVRPVARWRTDRNRHSQTDSKAILSQAEARLDALQTYQVKISRLERVNGQLQPEEDILLSIRRDPKAVRLEWSSGPNKGREVIYSSTLDPRMIFVHMPSTAIPLPVDEDPRR